MRQVPKPRGFRLRALRVVFPCMCAHDEMTEKHRAKQRCVGMSAEQLNLQQGAPIQLLSKRPGSTMWRVKDLQTGAP